MPQEQPYQNKDLLEALVQHLTDFVIVLLDRDGNFISWHPGVEEQFGYVPEEFIGRSGEILLPWSDRLKGRFRHELQDAAAKGRTSDTTWLIKKNGHPVFVEGVTVSIRHPETQQMLGFGKVLHDVTERKSTEDELKALAATLDQSVVFITDWNGIIEHWTFGCQRLYGWTEGEARGHRADELLATMGSNSGGSIEEILKKEGIWQGELQQKRKDGTPVYVSAHWTVLSQNPDEQPSIIATHTDITSRLQVQRQLEDANERLRTMAGELERSNAELEEFARIASHDLSAPITSTRWLVELLTNRHGSKLPDDGRDMLGQITLGLQRMNDLVEGILSHARAGMNPIATITPGDADEALDIALGNLEKDLTLSAAAVSREPLPKLRIEAQPLAQLFQNLISNAIKYRNPDVPLHIKVSAVRENEFWRLSVADNGLGIEQEWLERIFLPLQRRSRADIAGSGIGLATCKKIVGRAGGRIWAESAIGEGSTFYFTLPGGPE
jgi:PAS domain S-box-containing protein